MQILITDDKVFDALPLTFRLFLRKRRVKSGGGRSAYQLTDQERARLMIRARGQNLEMWLPFRIRRLERRRKWRAMP